MTRIWRLLNSRKGATDRVEIGHSGNAFGDPRGTTRARDKRRQPVQAASPDARTFPSKSIRFVECVREFTYLGSTFFDHWGVGGEVTLRIRVASVANTKLMLRVWRSTILPLILKTRLYVSLILSISLYGLAGRILTKTQVCRMERWHVRAVGRSLGAPVFLGRRRHEVFSRQARIFTIHSYLERQGLGLLHPLSLGEEGSRLERSSGHLFHGTRGMEGPEHKGFGVSRRILPPRLKRTR